MGQTGAVGDVFEVGQGLGVGIGDARTLVLLTEGDEGFRREIVMVDIGGRGLRDIVVLTVEAMEVTSRTGEGETLGTGMEVIQRLLLDGVDGQGAGLGVDFADEHAIAVATAATETGLALIDMAVMRTELTLDCPVLQFAIISTFETIHFSLFIIH